MLSKLGKISAAVVIASGGLLAHSDVAEARNGSYRVCTPNEWEQAQTIAATATYYDGGWWCGTAENGSCWIDDEEAMWYSVTFYFNGENPCPPILPGGGG